MKDFFISAPTKSLPTFKRMISTNIFFVFWKTIKFLFAGHTEVERTYPETDDEGIEKDSGECDDDTRKSDDQSLYRVLEVWSRSLILWLILTDMRYETKSDSSS